MTTYCGITGLEDLGDAIKDTRTGATRSKEEVETAFYDAYLQDAIGDEYGPTDYEAGYRAYLLEFKAQLFAFVNGEW